MSTQRLAWHGKAINRPSCCSAVLHSHGMGSFSLHGGAVPTLLVSMYHRACVSQQQWFAVGECVDIQMGVSMPQVMLLLSGVLFSQQGLLLLIGICQLTKCVQSVRVIYY